MGKKRNKNVKNKAQQNRSPEDKENREVTLEFSKNTSSDEPIENPQTQMELLCDVKFENYHMNCERVKGREYFVHSLCQVCKEGVDESEACPKCGLLRYCSARHRRDHWPAHADLCAAAHAVAAARNGDGKDHLMSGARDLPPDHFRMFRYRNMVECEARVERPLERWEREMFLFPNVCVVCYDRQHLSACERCRHASFCHRHAKTASSDTHSAWCEHLRRYTSVVKDRHRRGVARPSLPQTRISGGWPQLTNSEQFFHCISDDMDHQEFLELTETATYPLTVLHALAQLNAASPLERRDLVLHVVGAEAEFEMDRLEKWEYYVLHLVPTAKSLRVEFVGPELLARPDDFRPCAKCSKAGKSVSFGFHGRLYHETAGLPEPDLVCAFNAGLYRPTGFGGADTWGPCLPRLLAHPLLVTAYTAREARLDVARLSAATASLRVIAELSLNPFASLKPDLNFVSEEDCPVVFKNQYYSIVCNR